MEQNYFDLRAQRRNYYEGPGETRAAVLAGAGKYAERKIYLDFSHWNGAVDWDVLAKHPQIGGAYCKLGEPGPSGAAGDLISDAWQDDTFDANITGMYRNKLWIGAYTYLNLGWPLDRGWTKGGFEACHERGTKTEEQHANDLLRDLNIYITVRKVMQGAGRVFDAAKLKTLKAKPVDKIILDVEDLHLNNSTLIGDGWMNRTKRGAVSGLMWLAEHGYLGAIQPEDIWDYSSMWVIESYGNKELRYSFDNRPTICAGYYWNSTIKNVTVPQLVDDYVATIPNNWTPRLFGAPVMYQVADSFTLPEVNGGKSAVDVNVLNMTEAEFDALNPKWVARREAVIPDPEPEPEPVVRHYVTVKGAVHNIRQGVGITGVADVGDLTKGARMEVELMPGTVDGYQWAEIKGGLYIALTSNVTVETVED